METHRINYDGTRFILEQDEYGEWTIYDEDLYQNIGAEYDNE